MLPRSTACRHGDGRTWTKATSISSSSPRADHQVARFDVAVGDPGVPHGADQQQPLVGHRVVDVGLADLDGAGMELGDQHVLPLGGDLHDAVRPGRADPDVLQQAQRVVLVGDQAPHRLERGLVLQRAVQDGPPQLVPPVRADMALGVQLGEHELIRAAFDPQPQRGGARRGLQPDRLDLGHGEPELVADGLADRLAPPAGHIDVRGAAAPVRDGEHLVRGEEPERGDRDRHGERHAEQHVAGVIDAQVQAGQAEHGDDRGHRRLGPGTGTARHGQAVDGAQQEDRDDRHRGGHPGVPGPAADDRHAVRARPRQREVDPSCPTNSRNNRLPRNTSRCRQRRNAIVRATTDRPSAVAPQPEPATLIPLAASVSHGVRIPASQLRTQVLTRSSTRSHGVCCAARNAPARTMATRTSHAAW